MKTQLRTFALLGNLLFSANSFSESLTAYPGFKNAELCATKVLDFKEGQNVISAIDERCPQAYAPFLYSVTHENQANHHQGDAHYTGDSRPYMSDYSPWEIGKTLNYNFITTLVKDVSTPAISFALDTLNFPGIDITGRDVRNGFLFQGFSDLSINRVSLDKDFYVKLTFKIRGSEVGKSNISNQMDANRLILGILLLWPEAAPRKNQAHFLEFELSRTPDYHKLQTKGVCPSDGFSYELCYNDARPVGEFAEGKYAAINKFLEYKDLTNTPKLDKRIRVIIPLSQYIRNYGWVNPPSDWGLGKLNAVYLGMEGTGSTRLWVDLLDYQLLSGTPKIGAANYPAGIFKVGPKVYLNTASSSYCSLPLPSAFSISQEVVDQAPYAMALPKALRDEGVCKLPKGLYRSDSIGLFSNGSTLCHFKSGAHLMAYGFNQSQYDSAIQIGDYKQYNYKQECP